MKEIREYQELQTAEIEIHAELRSERKDRKCCKKMRKSATENKKVNEKKDFDINKLLKNNIVKLKEFSQSSIRRF